jgi:hypothetical protein
VARKKELEIIKDINKLALRLSLLFCNARFGAEQGANLY